ncbi:MAG: D-alanine--D-alanine ligase [Candidatus Aminicenantes bacterium]|nr:D-alanine--D-alanine ligase [Candidatus Aminicenantes bacterium]
MKRQKTTVGIIFGGMSAEHEVSIESAKAIVKNIDKKKYTPHLIYINKKGKWCQLKEGDLLDAKSYDQSPFFQKKLKSLYQFYSFAPWKNNSIKPLDCDIFFPMLHGPNGEDGKIQSLLELSNIPHIGANSFSSTLAMNKVMTKILFKQSGLNTPDFLSFTENNFSFIEALILDRLQLPVFVKPCSLGSSVGISKVKKRIQLRPAIDLAFENDHQIIIEQAIDAREIEISVMGNNQIKVSHPGELIPHNEFYDYADKYIENKTTFNIPARLDKKTESEVKEMAKKAYLALYLNGMARIDFFLEKKSNQLYINEINTIPGFTEISMFPKLWSLEGISFTDLITRLIEYGFEYYKEHNRLW